MRTLENKTEDNVETKGIQELLIETLKNIENDLPIDFSYVNVETIEYQRRDGFIPHSWNRGGADLIAFTDMRSLHGSGKHYNTKIEDHVNKVYAQEEEDLTLEFPDIKNGSDEFYELLDERLTDEYNALAWRIRIMYEGNNTITVYSGWDTDAPYFRWKDRTDFEKSFQFTNKKDLQKKLIKILIKAVDNM